MIPLPANVRVWLATGHTDMRKGFSSLGLIVQEMLKRDTHGGHLFVFRRRRGDLIKVVWHDGQSACLYTKRLDRGRFLWPSVTDGAVTISTAQHGYLLSGVDWRTPQESWRAYPGALDRDPARTRALLVQRLRDDRAGSGPIPSDPARTSGPKPPRRGDDGQLRPAPAAASPEPALRPRGPTYRGLDAGQLGRSGDDHPVAPGRRDRGPRSRD
ncbi:IS66 family insertion sequence element accessory protein TnpB [Methylobacterium sp. C25]|nr:IS66 family insertion sequence element accessory protein TnpB [Methylobacterium sp. C25]